MCIRDSCGIAIENRSSFISDKERVIKYANDNNIFIYGLSNENL